MRITKSMFSSLQELASSSVSPGHKRFLTVWWCYFRKNYAKKSIYGGDLNALTKFPKSSPAREIIKFPNPLQQDLLLAYNSFQALMRPLIPQSS